MNVCRILIINRHPVKSDEVSTPESISYTEDWLTWNGDLDNPNDCEHDCAVDVEFDMDQDNSIKNAESPEQQDVSATPYVPGLIPPLWKSQRHAEKLLLMVNAMERRRNKRVKKK